MTPQERITFIHHKGARVLCINFSGTKEKEFLETLLAAELIIRKEPRNSVLTLADMKDAAYTAKVIEAIKTSVEGNSPHTRARAVTGITDLKRVALNLINRVKKVDIRAFESREPALDWLVSCLRS